MQGQDFILDMDASHYAMGVVLSQLDKNGEEILPAFTSTTLCKPCQWYCATKRELYTVVYFMLHFLGYTQSAKVVIRSDHASPKWLMNFTFDDSLYHKWITEMHGYLPWSIDHHAGQKQDNANNPFQGYCDCKLTKCTACKRQLHMNWLCRDEDSPNSDDHCKKDVNDGGDGHPDLNDYAIWTCCYCQQAVCSLYAVTQAESDGL